MYFYLAVILITCVLLIGLFGSFFADSWIYKFWFFKEVVLLENQLGEEHFNQVQ